MHSAHDNLMQYIRLGTHRWYALEYAYLNSARKLWFGEPCTCAKCTEWRGGVLAVMESILVCILSYYRHPYILLISMNFFYFTLLVE